MTTASRDIALIGFMGTGKTTVGRLLAEKLAVEFVDVDARIEAQQGVAIVELFQNRGEAYFRDREEEMIAAVSAGRGQVIACGGGVVLRPANMAVLRRHGAVVCLTASPEVIIARTRGQTQRPLLNVADPAAAIAALLRQRQPLYAQADLVVDTSLLTAAAAAEKIYAWIQR